MDHLGKLKVPRIGRREPDNLERRPCQRLLHLL
jgi:hypothetical protein